MPEYRVVLVLLATHIGLVVTDQCYRCFGSDWCSNPSDPSFASKASVVNCPATVLDVEQHDDILLEKLLKNVWNHNESEVQSTTWGCVTATIHEDHEIHTVRTCLNNAAIICPTVQSVILNPDTNDVPDGLVLDCEGCVGELCNDHQFVEPDDDSSISTTTTSTSTTPSGPLQCYRCFGGNWCNDVNDPDFQANALVIDCPSSFAHHEYSGDNPVIAKFLDQLDKASVNASVQSTWGCVTATIHEAHEIHTIRTCLNNAAIICPTVQSVILNPDVNDVPSDVILDCDGCQGPLCNDHVFVDPSATSPSTGTSSSTSVTSPTTPESTTPSGPLQCYRCFGGNWCNDVNNPDFQSNAMIIDCPASSFSHLEYSGDNPATSSFLHNMEKLSSNASLFMDTSVQSTWGCVTATIHENHEIHTIRTCLNNAAIICPTVQSVILNPDVNDVPSDVVLDCDGCQGPLCNDHVFVDPSATSPSTGTQSSTSVTSPTTPESTTPSGPLQCYRCFGGNWCNDVNDPDFHSNAMIIDCPASSLSLEYSGESLAISKFLNNLNKLSSNTSSLMDESLLSTWGCVTATIHENHEIHTIRTCLNNAAIICPTVQSVILNPDVNDVPSDVILDCDGCQGPLCNDHVFVDPSATSSSIGTPSSTSVTSPTTPESTTPSGPLQCYRCFGGNWCNDVNDPDFQSNAMIIDCPASSLSLEYSGESLAISKLLDNINKLSSNGSSLTDSSVQSTWGCVTATIHENHEIHTIRTCLNNAAIICPTVQSVILNPDVNDVPSDVVLDCDGCQGPLCNDHVFVDPSATSPSTGTSSSTSVTSPTTPESTTPSGPLQCYRCFGGNWCNDVNDPDFQSNAMIIDCPASSLSLEYSGESLAISKFLDNMNKLSSNTSSLVGESLLSTWGCVTATIHENHEIHTIRTCLNNAAIICPTVQSVILNPDVNDVPSDVVLDCDGCQGPLCNDHVFVDPSATSSSTGTPSSTSVTSPTTSTTPPETTTPSGPLQCYRCFGGNWCNDVNSPEFESNVMIIDCPASSFGHHEYSGDNLAIATFLKNFDKASNVSTLVDASVQSTWGCVTTTIHENHEIHTIRTCLNNAAIICPTVQSVILNPDVNDVPSDVVLDCDGCQGPLCNDHVFVDPSATSPSTGTSSSTSVTSPTTPESTTPSGPLQCYRCFGGNWCNDVNDPDFQSNAMIIDCPASSFSHLEYSGESLAISKFLDNINKLSSNGSFLMDSSVQSTWGCVTATIHENHEIHTIRTCLNNAAIICPTVQSVILNPDVNDVPSDVVLDCDGCQGPLCNDHVFVDPSATSPSTGTPSSTSVTFPTTPESTTPSGPLQCYRCFGGNWCNDVNDPDFQSNAMIIDCPVSSFSHLGYSGDNLAIATFLKNLDKASNVSTFVDASVQSTWGCVTATIHENHEIHTIRTCLNNAAIICPTVQSVILNPDVNDVPSDVILDCDGCQGPLCNDHVFVDPSATSPSTGTPSSTSVTSPTTPESTTPSGPLQCYRCFGGNWCNDVNDPDFQSNAMIIDCPASSLSLEYSGESLAISKFLDNLNKLSSNTSSLMDESLLSTWGCVTATIHENHEIHTIRTCLNNAAIICPTVQSVILNPDVNDVPSDVVLDCDGCQGPLCNDHVFVDPSATSPSTGTPSSTSVTSPTTSTTPPETTTPSGPLQCYRCFGGNWCNDVNDPDFQSNAMIIDCPASSLSLEYSGESLAISKFLDNINKLSSNGSFLMDSSVQSTWGCVTATIHENHEIHTIRTCLNNAAIICPTVQSVILNPDVNDVPSDVVLDCDGCQGPLCNDHVFVDPSATSSSSGTPSSTSVTSPTTPESTTPSGPLQCYRCFGGNWCNDVNDPDFQSNAMIIDCPASSLSLEYSGESLAISKFLDNLNKLSSNTSSLMDESLLSTWGCVTATIHENHEIHTIRTCLNNAAIICPTVQSVILNPDVNDVPSDVILDCDGCQGPLCNDHVFVDPSATSSSIGTPSSTSVTSPTTPESTTPSGPLQCYRCFGGNWCNDVNDPDFQSNAMIIDCPASSFSHLEYSGDSLAIATFLKNLDKASNVSTFVDASVQSTWGCVTATIHENHEIHTIRTCLNNAAIICPTVQSVILNPDVNDVPSDVVLDCDGCQGPLCNDHVFVDPSATSPSTGTPSSTSVTSPTTPESTTPSGPLQCYRCFGGNWCNDVNDPDFQSNAMIIDCPASSLSLEYSGESLAISKFLDNLNKLSSNTTSLMDESLLSTWGCVTATIHENHEIHTIRTCLNNAAIICPTVQSVILNPDVNDVPSDVVLDCDGCQGRLCNDHVFVDPSATSPSTGTSSSTSVTSPTTPESTTPSGPLQCYRCFDGNWCNDVNNPDFHSNAMIIDCPASSLSLEYSGESLAISKFLDNINKLSSNGSSLTDSSVQSTWGCVTATIHENHEIHTIRTCLNNAAIICPTVQSVILNPDVNDVPSDVILDCDGCQGPLCNDHVFVDPSASSPSSSTGVTSSSTTPETTTPSGPLQCYRCFGGNWCNDVNDPDFQSNAMIIDCPASFAQHDYKGDSLAIATFLDTLDKISLNTSDGSLRSTWGCVTATIHEEHEVHTVRTCLNNAATICPTVQAVILNPDINEVPSDVTLDCQGCVGSLCNDHILIEPEETTTSSTEAPTSTSSTVSSSSSSSSETPSSTSSTVSQTTSSEASSSSTSSTSTQATTDDNPTTTNHPDGTSKGCSLSVSLGTIGSLIIMLIV